MLIGAEEETCVDTIAYFDAYCRARVVADASPVSLGAFMMQLQDGEWRVISYASRRLTSVEQRYSQTEEALVLMWACERFNLRIIGRDFELETDQMSLECLHSRTSKSSARIISARDGCFSSKRTGSKLSTDQAIQTWPMCYRG